MQIFIKIITLYLVFLTIYTLNDFITLDCKFIKLFKVLAAIIIKQHFLYSSQNKMTKKNMTFLNPCNI